MARALLTALLAACLLVSAGAVAGSDTTADASVVARYPAENGSMTETTVVTAEDVASAEPTTTANGRVGVTVTLTDEGAQSFADTLVDAGFTSERGTTNCPTDGAERNDEGYCLLTVLDGEVVYAAGLAPSLADHVESGAFTEDPQLLLGTATEENATRLARAFGASASQNTTVDSQSTTATTEATETTGTSVPGFSAAAALLAVAVVGAALARR